MQTQLWENPMYRPLCFRNQYVLSRQFTRNLCCSEMNYLIGLICSLFLRKSEPIEHVEIIHFAHHSPPYKRSYTCVIYCQFNKEAVNFDMQRWATNTDCSFALKFKFWAVFPVVLLQIWSSIRQTLARPWKWCVNSFTLKS